MVRCRSFWRVLLPLLLSSLTWRAAAFGAPLRVDFLDVGQGDATLITSPTGKTLLIDGGPPESSSRLVERLRRIGGPIDLILLSHRHLDHLGGLARIVETIGARTYMDAIYPHPSPAYARLIETIAERGVNVIDAAYGREVDLGGGATLRLLGPSPAPLRGTRSDVNANSTIARLDFGETSFLFTGDAEPETERWLLGDRERAQALRVRVVKVPHHGGRHSSTMPFVTAVGAEVAVISVGARNDYGHPTVEAIARWQRAGARVLRTDRDGEIGVISDGKLVEVITSRSGLAPASAIESPSALTGETTPLEFSASVRSRVFHRADCANAGKIAPRNLRRFATRGEAVASGRRPAGDCHP